jgi:regulator of CtrA degradation
MSQPATINPRIIDALYCEALVLADEVRTSFDRSMHPVKDCDDEDLARIALSCEALRTTTRMMHALAWLLNYRAYFNGELTEFQLLRQGRLAPNYPGADAERLPLLDAETRALIGATERFYARLVRIDRGWRQGGAKAPTAISRLEERLGISAAN